MKLLTIVVPSYNVETYLSKTIESIMQCKRKEKIDLIIVNDGSKDQTLNIAMLYKEKYLDIITVRNKENGGHGSAINSGLEIAKGKFFCIVDGDDWVDSNKLDEFIEFIENIDTDVIITGHYRDYVNTGIREIYKYGEEKGFLTDVDYLLKKNYRIPMTDICYKTCLLRDVNLKIQEKTFYVDEEFCTYPFQMVKSVLFFSEGFYHYRIGDVNQSISDINMVKRIGDKLRVFYRISKDIHQASSNIDQENYEYIRRKLVGIANSILMVYYIYFLDRKQGRLEGERFLEKIGIEYPDIAKDCEKIGKIFYLMNLVHMRPKVWKGYKYFKKKIFERRVL